MGEILGWAINLGEGKLCIQTKFTALENWPCAISCSWQRDWVNPYTAFVFYGILTLVGYLIPIPIYIYIWFVSKEFLGNYFKQVVRAHLFQHH